jgi:type IV pilus assembly protein PilV
MNTMTCSSAPRKPSVSPLAAQAGMTLIEILVAIVVLAIGLLGLAGLQLKGIQVNQGSTWRWQAAALAEDLADRIRADQAGAVAGYYNITAGAPVTTAGNAATQAAVSEWLARVRSLPGGSADVAAYAGGAANQLTISVSWDDSRGAAGASAGSVSNTTTTPTSSPAAFVINTELYD